MQTVIGRHTVHLATLIVLTASLAACGGGGGDSASSANATEPASAFPAAPGPAPASPPSTNPSPTNPPSESPPLTSSPPASPSPTSPSDGSPQTPITQVPESNRAPTIAGTPVTRITSGQAYNFVPSAADADNDSLQFSISSKPGWATFDAASGRLWGVPSTAGSYEEIEISVSDGKAVTKLPQFAIVVDASAPTLRSVHISWQPPLTNTDGSTLTDLKGYRIVYGTQAGQYTSSIPVNGTGVATYTVENLPTGQKYYFAMVSVNSAGTESDYSREVVVNLL